MKTLSHFELLNQIEAKVEDFSKALRSNHLEDMVGAAVSFQMASVELSRSLQQTPARDVATKRKLDQLAALIGAQRVALMRRSALVERGLETLVPAIHSDTYGPSTGKNSGSLYASAGRSSGEFGTSVA